MKRTISALTLFSALVMAPGPALANEFTDVIDAFDMEIHDPFDANISVGYEYLYRKSVIRREVADGTTMPHDWDYFGYRNMFEFKQKQHILNLGLDIGIFHDLSLRVDLPLILKDQRQLAAHGDFTDDATSWGLMPDTSPFADNAPQLFSVPFKSPDRSGVDYLSVGLWWNPIDQSRDDTKPVWTIFAEGHFSVGKEMLASCAKGQALVNPHDGSTTTCEAAGLDDRGGMSRGVHEVLFGTRLSRRYGMLDPYFGFDAQIGWAKDGTAYFIEGAKAGQINTMPPVTGHLDFGLEIIPWDVPDKHRKLSINIGAGGIFHSEGRDYTPLYDALGTSLFFTDDRYYPDYNGDGTRNAGEVDANGKPTPPEDQAAKEWSGMTDIENYATFHGKLVVMVQPAKYVKFLVGSDFGHETEHFITKTDQCGQGSIEEGICTAYNYGSRPELDTPGNRYRSEKTFIYAFWLDAVAMF